MTKRIALCALSIAFGTVPATAQAISTPGYDGRHKAPKTKQLAPAPDPFVIGPGDLTAVLVDAAGTGHIAVTTLDGKAGYCRVKRGAGRCDVARGLDEQQPSAYTPPQVVAYGDTLVVIVQRRQTADAADDGGPVVAHVSEDGGASFKPPAIIGGQTSDRGPFPELNGAAVFGPPGDERIALFYEGGWFETVAPGARPSGLTDLFPELSEESRAGAIASAPDGGLVVALREETFKLSIKTWNRTGDPRDPAQWVGTSAEGTVPELGGGPGGVGLVTGARGELTPVVAYTIGRDGAVSKPTRLNGTEQPAGSMAPPFVDAAGTLHAAWTQYSQRTLKSSIVTRTLRGGRPGDTDLLYRTKADNQGLGALVFGAAGGGGFAVFSRGHDGIVVDAFGSQEPTNLPGLGGVLGGQGAPDPGVSETCSTSSFAEIDIVASGGCLLGAVGQPATKVATDTIRLNGLEIVPDDKVKILINSRNRTIDTTGKVTVQLRLDDIVIPLLHEEIHFKLPSGDPDLSEAAPGCKGQKLIGYDSDRSNPSVKGFPIRGQIAIFLREDSVCIPVALGLPKALGDIRGNAVLTADNEHGLIFDSLRITAPRIPLGPALIEKLDVKYARVGDQWDGAATIGLPPQPGGVKLGGRVRFGDGAFKGASIVVSPPHPGLPLFTGVFLRSFGGGFFVDPLTVEAYASVGALPVGTSYAIGVEGTLKMVFADPSVFQFTGVGSILDVDVATAQVVATTNGFFRMKGDVYFDFAIVQIRGGIDVFVDVPSEQFSGKINAELCALSQCAGAIVIVSTKGMGGCIGSAPFAVTAGYLWGEGPDATLGSCDMEPYEVPLPPGAPGRRQALAPGTFVVAEGEPLASVRVQGDGAAPALTLVAPDGTRITPSSNPKAPEAKAVALTDPKGARTYVAVKAPMPGTWRVEAQPDSAPIIDLRQSHALPAPEVTGTLSGKGRRRTLRYTATQGDGLETTFVERDTKGNSRVLGTAAAAAGRLRFSTGDGEGGVRSVSAVVTRNGIPRLETALAGYVAPAPPRPAKPKQLRVRRARGGLVVRWRGRAAAYLVTARLPDGRTPVLLTRKRSVRIPRARSGVVRVVGRDRAGRSGPAARKRVRRR